MNDLMVIKQLPVIEEQLKAVSAEIDEKLAIVEGLVVSEETVKEVKKIRTEFTKEFDVYEEQRKAIKEAVMAPYTQLEAVYKECVSDKFKAADATLKAKIGEVEDELKARKFEKIREYYNEYAAAKHVGEYADFDRQMARLVRMSDTDTALKRVCREMIDPLVSGLSAIDAQPEELRAEILAEFRVTLRATEAISIVAARHKAIEEQKIRQEEREARQAAEAEAVKKVEEAAPSLPTPLAPPTPAPVVEDDPVLKITFTVTDKRSKLRELKKFLTEGGYRFE